VHSYVVTGPLLPKSDQEALHALGETLPNLRLVPFDPDYAAVVRAADVVVSMGGYNSLTEAAFFGKRAIVVPRVPGPEEQMLRAAGFAHRGLATLIPPLSLTPARLWQAIDAELARPPLTEQPLSFTGLERIACELAGLVGE
jgi:predicted glycosyltransferase